MQIAAQRFSAVTPTSNRPIAVLCITLLLYAAFLPMLGRSGLAAEIVFLGARSAPKQSLETIDHASWTSLLARYVDTEGRVSYQRWKTNTADVRQLDDYLVRLSSGDLRQPASRESQLAFWINAYNAVTVRGILREYPTTSIRNHTPRLWGYNIWKHLQLYVGGTPYSLDQIEHEVLRKMAEPRIHFAIVCASKGCPRLLNEAYTAVKLEEQLEANAKDFFQREENFRYEPGSNRFLISSILDWFGDDFGPDQQSRLKTISRWLSDTSATKAARENDVRIEFLEYDWSLNEQ